MSYIEPLLELIKNEKEISDDGRICLSLAKIANVWGTKPFYKRGSKLIIDIYDIDSDFLETICSSFKKLQNEEIVGYISVVNNFPMFLPRDYSFSDINNIKQLSSPQDKICFVIKGDIDNYLKIQASKKEVEKQEKTQIIPTTKIEITKIPDIKFKGLEKLPQKKKKQIRENVLRLNKVGDLYREPKEKYCYSMSEAEGRHKIVRYFVENKIYNYYSTRELAMASGKNENQFMKEVGKINSLIQGKLKLNDKVVEGRQGSGYGLNPKYKIILKNE